MSRPCVSHVEGLEYDIRRLREALAAAHKHIADDRDRFIEGCVNRATGAIDEPEDQAAVRQYNDLLAQIEDAIKTGGAA